MILGKQKTQQVDPDVSKYVGYLLYVFIVHLSVSVFYRRNKEHY